MSVIRCLRSLVLICCLLALVGGAAFGAPNPDAKAEARENLERLGFTVTDRIPGGVAPLEVASLEELRTLARVIRSLNKPRELAPTENLALQVATTPQVTVREIHCSCVVDPVWRTRFNLWADVYVATYTYGQWIDAVRNVRVGLTGVHPFSQLEDTYADAYIYSGAQRVRITGGGTLTYYLFFQTLFAYYSVPVSLVHYWSP